MVNRAPKGAEAREAVAAVSEWLHDDTAPAPDRAAIARAVRLTARALAAAAPGSSVELRVPPFIAVQCVPGPRHTRGTPANVVETDPRTWLMLSAGLVDIGIAVAAGSVQMSGTRAAEIGHYLPFRWD